MAAEPACFHELPLNARFAWMGDAWIKVGVNHAKREGDLHTRFVPSHDQVEFLGHGVIEIDSPAPPAAEPEVSITWSPPEE